MPLHSIYWISRVLIMIEFILNNVLIRLDDIKADTTLLDFLRLNMGLKGTKEGCASGDCGACTVVVATPNESFSHLKYKTLNSCICLLGSLHGKQIITVEGLQGKNGVLHPVQKSLVDHHASQCGFCTPGFVMSVFAMTKQASSKESTTEIINHLDGNLCRCTGYRPIIDASKSFLENKLEDNFDLHEKETLAILKGINTKGAIKTDKNQFFIPETLDELSKLIKHNPEAKLLAGGTDLALEVTQGLKSLDQIIYLGNLQNLKNISHDNNELVIGSAVTYEASRKILCHEYPVLEAYLNRIGSLQIRNVATIGGNIANASPIGDMPPVLVALDAQLSLQKGVKIRRVGIDIFYTGYKQTILDKGEFIRSIHIPKASAERYFNVYKISKRHADDISAVCGAFNLKILNKKIVSAKIAFGGMAATVKRAIKCEKALENKELTSKTLQLAEQMIVQDFKPLDDVRASQDYRLKMARNMLRRLFFELERLV